MSEILKKHGFNFQKKYGQNFLQDIKIPRRIADECTEYNKINTCSHIDCDKKKIPALILEIGPGAGILTKELAELYEKVIAVEIDTALEPVLDETLKNYQNTEVIFGDIMEMTLSEIMESRRINKNGEKLPVSVCANLPYYITTPILLKLIQEYRNFDYITIMVQKEVAARLTALPDTAEYGSITAAINLHASVKKLFTVSAGCFFPRPKVDSTVIRLKMYKPPKYTPEQISSASRIMRAAFSVRRKTLVNALLQNYSYEKHELTKLITETLNLGESVRGEKLSAEQFVLLGEKIK